MGKLEARIRAAEAEARAKDPEEIAKREAYAAWRAAIEAGPMRTAQWQQCMPDEDRLYPAAIEVPELALVMPFVRRDGEPRISELLQRTENQCQATPVEP
jgi:hypothetical protein